MKKNIFFAVICLFAFFALTSCQQKQSQLQPMPGYHSLVSQQVTVTSPQFFYVVEEVVQKGQTVWGRAQVYYGNGARWTDIVAKNEFLQKPGRVWQDKTTGIWYALIKPGEKLIIDSQEVNPVFVEIVDAPYQQPVQQEITNTPESSLTWWGWVLIILGIILLGIIIYLITRQNHKSHLIVIPMGSNINDATRLKILDHEHNMETRTLSIFERAHEKGKLEELEFNTDRLGMKGKIKAE